MYHVLTKMIEGDQQAFHTLYDATYKDVYRTVSFWWIIRRIAKIL